MTSIEEIKEILKELTLSQKETDKQIKAVNEQLGGIGNSMVIMRKNSFTMQSKKR